MDHFHLDWPTVNDCVSILMTKLQGVPVEFGKNDEEGGLNPLKVIEKLALNAIDQHDTFVMTESSSEFRCEGLTGASIDLLCQNAIMRAVREVIHNMQNGGGLIDLCKFRVESRHFSDNGKEEGDKIRLGIHHTLEVFKYCSTKFR